MVGGGDIARRIEGAAFPSLAFASTRGGTVGLAQAQGIAVVFLYPWTGRPGVANPPGWDDIPGAHGSTPEAEGFAQQHDAYVRAGLTIYGLSGQSRDWQAEFSERMRLPFALLSDEPLALARTLDLPTFETGGVVYLTRLTLVVRDGRIIHVTYPVEEPAGHAARLFEALQGLGLLSAGRR